MSIKHFFTSVNPRLSSHSSKICPLSSYSIYFPDIVLFVPQIHSFCTDGSTSPPLSAPLTKANKISLLTINIIYFTGGRKGLCPYVRRLIPHLYGGVYGRSHEPPSLCGNLCASDHSCPGLQKCCPTNCGYACFDPVFVTEH